MNLSTQTPPADNLRILLAEDEPRDADLLQRELRREGMVFEARRVDTREGFLRELQQFRPHIVLSDYGMPSFDGMAALCLTREHVPETPFIVVTGSLNEETAVALIKAGADDYILKDRLVRLPAAVEAALHKASLEREKREAEEAMHHSAREWATTFDAMADPICVLGLDRKIQRCNRAFREFAKRDCPEVVGKTICEVMGHGEPTPGSCPFLAMLETHGTFHIDVAHGERWYAVKVDPVLAEDGSLLGGIHVMTDITDRRQSEERLRESERKFRTLFNSMADAAFIVRPNAGVLEVNEEACRRLGYDRPTLLTMSPNDFDSPESVASLTARLLDPANREGFMAEAVHVARDGRKIPTELNFRWIDYEGAPAVLSLGRDITERKQLESELVRRERQLNSFFTGATAGLALLDRQMRFVQVNDTMAQMHGLPASEHIGKPVREVIPDLAPELEAMIGRILQSGDSFLNVEMSGETPATPGVRRHWMQSSFPVMGADGKPEGVGTVVVEITKQKQAEAAVRESEERYRSLFVESRDAILITSPDRGCLAANPAAVALFACRDEQDLIARIPKSLSPEYQPDGARSVERVPLLMRQALEEGSCYFEWTHRRADGTEFPATVLLSRLGSSDRGLLQATVRDITELKNAQAAVQEQLHFLQSLLDALPTPVLHKDLAGRYTMCNRAFAEMHRRPVSEILGKTAYDLLPYETAKEHERIDHDVLEHPRPHHYETTVNLLAGGPRQAVIHRAAVLDLEGRPSGIIGVVVDITELKNAQAALQEQLRFVQSLLDTLPTPVFHKDLTGRYTVCNRAFGELCHLPPADILRKTVHDVMSPEMAEAQDRMDRELVENAVSQRMETTVAVPGFAPRKVVIHKALAQDLEGRPSGIIGVIMDITELKDAQAALQASHEKYRSMVDNVGIGVALIDPDMRILEMNAQMRAWFPGAQPGGPEPCHRAFNDPPRAEPCSYCPTIQTLADGEVHEAITQTPAGGQIRNYRIVASPVRDATGRVIAAIEMVEDITERQTLEAQLRQSQKMEAVGQLAGGVAHDFNNILTGIMGYTRLQLEDAAPDSELFEDLTEVMELSQRAANLTRQLLAFSRRQTLIPLVLDLNSVVADMTKMLGRLIGEDIDLRFIPGQSLDCIKADPGQVEQVLMNLAVNARDAMPQGGQLTIETSNVTLDEHYAEAHLDARPGKFVQLAVTDTGCGMSQETLQHIFEPFFTTKEVGKGTGLGLATTFGIVKQHSGSLQVYSEPGCGTTFRVYFPVTTEVAGGPAREIKAEAKGGDETILLVEDEEAVRHVAERILTQHGYQVLAAGDAEEAQGLFAEQCDRIALVLTDVIMPGASGRELSERLRVLNPSLRVLFMSGYSDNAIFRHGVLGEGQAFIGKPFTQEDLLTAVRRVLDVQ